MLNLYDFHGDNCYENESISVVLIFIPHSFQKHSKVSGGKYIAKTAPEGFWSSGSNCNEVQYRK